MTSQATTQQETNPHNGNEFSSNPEAIRNYTYEMLDGLSDLAARSGDRELQNLLNLSAQAVQTLIRTQH